MSTFSRFSVLSYKIFFMKRERIKYILFFHFEYLIMGAKSEKEFDYTNENIFKNIIMFHFVFHFALITMTFSGFSFINFLSNEIQLKTTRELSKN